MILLTSLLLAIGLFEPPSEQLEGSSRARMRLLAESNPAAPGGTVVLGVHFDIDPGWHLYWNGQNDSGMPPELELELPPGFETGQIQWPAPKRHVSEGDILDHVYERRVTLLVPLAVPTDAPIGTRVRIAVRGKWLVCSSVCLPGEGQSTLELAIATTSAPAPAPTPALFAEARARLPRPVLPGSPGLTVAWRADTLTLEVSNASGMTFFPDVGSAMMAAPIADGDAKTARLQITFKPALGQDRIHQVSGVLEVRRHSEKEGSISSFYSIKVPGPDMVTPKPDESLQSPPHPSPP
jgi:thiol:disulfide interchange protein DsbD